MKIFEYSQIGEFHLNHNEDHSVICEIGKNKMLIAVMDGCTMGEESHFASSLIGKILRKISKVKYYQEFIEKSDEGLMEIQQEVLRKLFIDLREVKNYLDLERNELLSTLILGIVDFRLRESELIAIGDGLIMYNGEKEEYEQDNKPDYLGYHLNECFDDWYEKQKQKLSLSSLSDLSLSTDGIFSFKQFDPEKSDLIEEQAIIENLLQRRIEKDESNILKKEVIKIEKRYGYKPSDDLTIIRMIFDEQNDSKDVVIVNS